MLSISAINRSSGPVTAWIVLVDTLRGARWSQLAVAKKDLNDTDVDILFEQMRSEAVTKHVRTDALAEAGDFGGLLDHAMQLP